MRKKHILHIDSYAGIGGGQSILAAIVGNLGEEFDMTVAAPGVGKLLGAESLPINNQGLWGRVQWIRELYRSGRFDVVHAHGTRASAWARLAAIGLRCPPIVYTLHGFHIARRRWIFRGVLLMLERFLNSWKTAKLICVSEADKKLARGLKIVDPGKLMLIRNGIDVARFRRGAPGERKKLGLGREACVVVTVARLHPPKDFGTLIKAFGLAIQKRPELRLLIVGDGPLKEEIHEMIKGSRIEKEVTLLSTRKDIERVITLADIVVLSSDWEGLPLITLEAGAAGRPVIASDVGGVSETVLDGKTGYLFPAGNEAKLAELLIELTGSRQKREKMGRAAYKFVRENFDQKIMLDQHRKLYRSI